jgi:hypothetical protein
MKLLYQTHSPYARKPWATASIVVARLDRFGAWPSMRATPLSGETHD